MLLSATQSFQILPYLVELCVELSHLDVHLFLGVRHNGRTTLDFIQYFFHPNDKVR